MTVKRLLKMAKADFENKLEPDAHCAIYQQGAPEEVGVKTVAALRKANGTMQSITQLSHDTQLEIFDAAIENS